MMAIKAPIPSVQPPGLTLSLSELLTQYLRGLAVKFWYQMNKKIRRSMWDTLRYVPSGVEA